MRAGGWEAVPQVSCCNILHFDQWPDSAIKICRGTEQSEPIPRLRQIECRSDGSSRSRDSRGSSQRSTPTKLATAVTGLMQDFPSRSRGRLAKKQRLLIGPCAEGLAHQTCDRDIFKTSISNHRPSHGRAADIFLFQLFVQNCRANL